MRLQTKELTSIRRIVKRFFDDGQIYIFGSQLDTSKRGGDIDIFIISQHTENLQSKTAQIKFLLENTLLKPIDIVIHQDFGREIEQQALNGIPLF
jgi:predicted nucleotidyltransferase